MEATGAATVRPRKACVQCYQKKVRCDFSTDLASCSRCRNSDLECALPEGTQTTSRSSIRSGFEELSSRVQNLEQILLLGPDSSLTPFDNTAISEDNQARSSLSSRLRDPVTIVSSPEPSRVSSYRGTTSPWSTLVNRLDSGTGSKQWDSFQDNVARLANEERSTALTGSRISFNFLQEFPGLQQDDDILRLIKTYAIEAPYPILHYHSLTESTFRILHTHRAECWGQVICILLYMAFGVARTFNVESSISPEQQSGVYMQRAWDKLPNLIIDHNLWSLKALTLMVHYLQASSKPEPCWALLGTASRMAISLGFHQKGRKVDSYSVVEMEEGRRAWWLCYIMEKTFCTTFGYPSLTASSREAFDAEYPTVFKPTTFSGDIPEDIAIFGQNEIEAVAFFKDLIELTHSREDALSSSNKADLDVEPMKSLLPTKLKDNVEGEFTLASDQNLRMSISDLAHYNAIQVISMHTSPHSSFPHESLVSARWSIQIILETKTAGTTMCLWMWLYYAFTAVVTLFLQILTAPLHPDAILDLALLSDLQALCEPLVESSAGAKRVMDIIVQMEKVALEVMKLAARTKAGKRAAVDEVGTEVGRQKIQKSMGEFEGNSELAAQGRGRDSGALLEESGVENAVEDSTATGIVLASTPQTFQWDQWDQWLDDVPFELE